ncbi:MAG: cell division protein FtsL [Pseudomonadota bacterium]
MPAARTEQVKADFMTVRKGNRKMTASFFAAGDRLFFACSTAAILMVFSLLFVWSNYQSIQAGYSITALIKEQVRLTDLNRKYKVEMANLASLDRLEQVARDQLGLVPPGPEQVQVIE